MNAVNRETAEKEVTAWLDYKQVKTSYREKRKDAINVLIDGVMDGNLTIAAGTYSYGEQKLDGPVITQVLSFPAGTLTELKYKPRETTGKLSESLRIQGEMPVSSAYASVLLADGILPAQLEKLDTEDSRVLQAIVSFFL